MEYNVVIFFLQKQKQAAIPERIGVGSTPAKLGRSSTPLGLIFRSSKIIFLFHKTKQLIKMVV
jgi:hypothetical protein